MKNYANGIILSSTTALLLYLSWPESGMQTWMVFIALTPLFHFIHSTNHLKSVFLFSFISFFAWHLSTDWWMIYSTIPGSISAWVINSSLMALVILAAKFCSNQIKNLPFELFLIPFWLSFEIFHLNWDLQWPWMNLGHAFANQIKWIQWYEYTGIYGGSAWILLVNSLFYRLTINKNFRLSEKSILLYGAIFSLIAFPILLSHAIYHSLETSKKTKDVCIVQPNIDTYSEKFNALTPLEQSLKIIDQIKFCPPNELIILPETAIPEPFNLDQPFPKSIDTLLSFSKDKNLHILGGFYTKTDDYDYNSVLLIEEGKFKKIRNKMKLLPYAEKVPLEFLVDWSKIVYEQGGIKNSFGVDSITRNINYKNTPLGSLICFESVFQDLAANMSRKGAQAFIVITNDDWWGNTAGHKQHFAYSRIRAIENRRSIARSANTGISGIINSRGDIINSTTYKEKRIIHSKIDLNKKLTYFSKNEKNIRYSILCVAAFIFITSIISLLKKKQL